MAFSATRYQSKDSLRRVRSYFNWKDGFIRRSGLDYAHYWLMEVLGARRCFQNNLKERKLLHKLNAKQGMLLEFIKANPFDTKQLHDTCINPHLCLTSRISIDSLSFLGHRANVPALTADDG